MAPLFFAVAAASSDASGPTVAGPALLPGAPAWQSARCCTYPQALLLQLEGPAEVENVEVSVRGDLAPKAVDVYLSRGGGAQVLQGSAFDLVGTIHFDGQDAPRCTPRRGSPALRKGRLRLFALCSGQVRLLVHEPLASSGMGNPYRQVSLTTVEIYGREGKLPPQPAAIAPSLGGAGGDEVAQVLLELGVPLDIVPVDEDADRSGAVDAGTRQLLAELQRRRPQLLQASRFGEAQELSEHLQHLGRSGAELRSLRERCDRCAGAGELREAQRLSARIRELEEQRLSIAALYETDFWLERMVLPQDGAVHPDTASPTS